MSEMRKAETGLLVPIGDVENPYEETFVQVATGGKFWPRLQLFGSNSDLVKEEKLEVCYAIVTGKDQLIPLGKQIDILPLAWRPRAIDVKADPVLSTSDINSELFKELKAKADVPDSGAMFGPEYAVYVPEAKMYCTLFMGSKTSRREAPKVKSLIGRAATLKINLFSNKKYKWHGIVCVPCSTPFDIPSVEEIKAKIAEFLTAEEEDVEGSDPVDPDEASRPR